MYVSTIINYLYLHNFNGIVAITLTVLIAVTALFLSRKRESTIIRVIGFLGCYTCLYPIGGPIQEANFLVLTIILFIINGMTVLLPVKKNEKAIVVLHTCAHVVFTIALLVVGLLSRINEPYLYIFLASSVMILNAVFMGVEMTAGMVAVFCGGLFAESLLYFGLAEDCVQIWMAPVTLLPVCLLFFFINRKKPIKWIQYWFFLLVMYYQYGIGYWNEGWTPTICVLAIFASAKLLSRIYYLKTSEVIITSVTMLIAVGNILSGNVAEGACFAGAFLLSVAALKYWRTLYECMITVVVALFLWMNVDFPLNLAICVGLLLLGILAFNHIKWWRGAKVTVYNYGSLAVMCLLYLGLAAVDNYLIYFIMLLFGISTIILVLQNKYGIHFKHKHMIMAVFLTYMAFICKIEIPIVISVILLVIAIGSVASGFYHKEKQMRIYGLILSLFACAKVLLFDFYGAATLQKTILFFIMGSIVLAISYIYIRLEKNMDKTDNEEMKG